MKRSEMIIETWRAQSASLAVSTSTSGTNRGQTAHTPGYGSSASRQRRLRELPGLRSGSLVGTCLAQGQGLYAGDHSDRRRQLNMQPGPVRDIPARVLLLLERLLSRIPAPGVRLCSAV